VSACVVDVSPLSIVGLPLGTMIFNRYGQILTLRPVHPLLTPDGPSKELPIILRIIYFFVIGWWLGLLTVKVGWLLCVSVIGLPLGVALLNQVPLLMTLKQNY